MPEKLHTFALIIPTTLMVRDKALRRAELRRLAEHFAMEASDEELDKITVSVAK